MGGDNIFSSELSEEQLNICLLHQLRNQQKLITHVGSINEEESNINNVKDQIVKEDQLLRFTSFLRVDNSFFTPCWNPSHDQIGKEEEFSRFTSFLRGDNSKTYGGIESIRYMNFAPGSSFSVNPVSFLSDIQHYGQSSGTMSEAGGTNPKTSEVGIVDNWEEDEFFSHTKLSLFLRKILAIGERKMTEAGDAETKACEERIVNNWEEDDDFFSHTKLSLFLRKMLTVGEQKMTEAGDTKTKVCEERIVNNWEEEDDFFSHTKLSLFLRKILVVGEQKISEAGDTETKACKERIVNN